MRASWLADVLRAAGITVVEHAGWKGRGTALVDVDSIVWHHDGSPPGATPSVPQYMAGQIDHGKPGAQCWVALDGTWHLVADGKVFHTGEVRVGKSGNSRALGIETDHTTGETWSGVHLLDSLRRGTAAILQHLDATEQAVEFHKTICSPPGRKTDPDGLDLAVERRAVAALLAHQTAPAVASHPEDQLHMDIAKDTADARHEWVRRTCLTHWGYGVMTAADQDYLVKQIEKKGLDLTLAEIVDHSRASTFRKNRGW